MIKKIQKGMLLVVFLSVVLGALGFGYVFFETSKSKDIDMVRKQVSLIQKNLVNTDYDDIEYSLNEVLTQSRITLVDLDGTVLFDNRVDASKLENHNSRLEIKNAREKGFDEEQRRSESLESTQYYYALLLEDGKVLRVSTEILSYATLFRMMLPFTLISALIITLFASYIARNLTKNIVEPILEADLKSELISPYVELDVYFNTMREQKLEIERQLLRVNKRKETINTILNTMQEGFLIVDDRKNVFLANQAFLEMNHLNGYSIGESVFRFINDGGLLQRVHAALKGKSSSYKMEKDNKIYQVFISPTRIAQDNVAILLFVDISLEYENQKHREEFSANVSHELKTPLTSIKGLAELQANNLVAPEDVQEFGKKIFKQSERLLELIDHTIRLSKLDEDKMSLEKEVIHLRKIVNDVLDNLNAEIDNKKIELIIDVDEVSIYANYQMIDELFYNLIENAIKYNHEGGWVKVSVKDLKKELLIEISDGGLNIPNHAVHRIFERFYRVDSSRDKKTGGTGLGLAIVKHIVMYHDGSIEVINTENTTFRIKIPI